MKKLSEKAIRNRIKRFVTTEFQCMYTILWTAKLLEEDVKQTAIEILFQMCGEGFLEIEEKRIDNVTYRSVRKR